MAITLTDRDLEDLARLVEDFRHREATSLLGFFSPRIQAARVAEARINGAHVAPDAPRPEIGAIGPMRDQLANGHTDRAPASAPTG